MSDIRLPIDHVREFFDVHIRHKYGLMLAGALFGLGWWAYVDAATVATTPIHFKSSLPGIGSTVALLLINAVRYDEITSVDPWDDEGVCCRSRVWLLGAYGVCAVSIAGAVLMMIGSGGAGVGLAAVFQVACILASALLFFVSRSEGESDGSYGLL